MTLWPCISKPLSVISLSVFLLACSAAPDPICSRLEALENQQKCPAPPPPVTRKSELSEEEHRANLENARYSTTADLGPEAQAKRKAILERIEALKSSLPAQEQSDLQASQSHAPITSPSSPENAATPQRTATEGLSKSYSVQLGAFKQRKGREALSEQLLSAPVYTYQMKNGLYALSIGSYSSMEAAAAAAVQARNQGFKGAYAVPLPTEATLLENNK